MSEATVSSIDAATITPSFRERVELRKEDAEKKQAKAAQLGWDEDRNHADGRVEELEWLLDQDPIVLSGEDRERLIEIAECLESLATNRPQRRAAQAALLRNLAAGQGEGER